MKKNLFDTDIESDYVISDQDRKAARFPHNLFMLNLALVHLMMTPAIIALGVGLIGVLIPLSVSLCIIAYTYVTSNKQQLNQHPYVQCHWSLALKHYVLLIISYVISVVLMAIGALFAMTSQDPNMQDILQTIFIRISVMPVLLMVMICFYLESSALGETTQKNQTNKN